MVRGLSCVAAFIVAATVAVLAQAPPTPELTKPVNDFAGVIDAGSVSRMEREIRALQAASGDTVVVATVATLEGYTGIEELAVKLFENHGRGIGAKGMDNGVLIVVAMKERQVRIEVGYDLEQWITDGYSGETIREFITPAFRRQAYGEGLAAGVSRIVARVAQARGVTLQGVPTAARQRGRESGVSPLAIVVLIIIVVVLMGRMGGGRGGRGGRSQYWGSGRQGWSGWSSGVGGFGGGWSGGRGGGFGGGFGGFGGGRSGGGGASGSW